MSLERTLLRYRCGCLVYEGGHPSACPLHGHIIEPPARVAEPLLTIAVQMTSAELHAFAGWLLKQTFPYDEEAVHTAAARIINRSQEAQ